MFVQMSNWPFASLRNTLRVIMNSVVAAQSQNECDVTTVDPDENGNLQGYSYKAVIDDVTLYLENFYPLRGLAPPRN